MLNDCECFLCYARLCENPRGSSSFFHIPAESASSPGTTRTLMAPALDVPATLSGRSSGTPHAMVSAGGSPRRNGGGKSGGCVPTSVESAQNEVVELRGALKRVYSKRQEVNKTLKTVALTVGWAEADVVQACPCATCLGMSPMLISPDIHCRSVRFWGESHLQQQCS